MNTGCCSTDIRNHRECKIQSMILSESREGSLNLNQTASPTLDEREIKL